MKFTTKFCVPFFLFHNIVARVIVCLYSLLLMLSGDVEINSGHLGNCKKYFSICHWNLSSTSVPDYSKLFLLKAYIILYKFYFICLSETYLVSTNPTMMTNYKFLGTFLFVLTIHLKQNVVESVYIIRVLYR